MDTQSATCPLSFLPAPHVSFQGLQETISFQAGPFPVEKLLAKDLMIRNGDVTNGMGGMARVDVFG